MFGLDQSPRYACRSTSPPPPAPLPRSGFVHRPISCHSGSFHNSCQHECRHIQPAAMRPTAHCVNCNWRRRTAHMLTLPWSIKNCLNNRPARFFIRHPHGIMR